LVAVFARRNSDSGAALVLECRARTNAVQTHTEADRLQATRFDPLIDLLSTHSPVFREFRNRDVLSRMGGKIADGHSALLDNVRSDQLIVGDAFGEELCGYQKNAAL
jgi:hypothetical protein